jgi:aminoglycoside 6'-N-acetyltransferase I
MGDLQTPPLESTSASQRIEAAEVLQRALSHAPSAWHDPEAAKAEVDSFIGASDRLAFAAVEKTRLVGWIGGIRHRPFAWELHPLVIDPTAQRRGYGALLVRRLERAAADAGVCTIWLGTDDDFGGTNLFGVDLYPDVLKKLARLAPTTGHPFSFYLRQGYTVVGVLPDSDGPGRHDIIMAKRIRPRP